MTLFLLLPSHVLFEEEEDRRRTHLWREEL
jgi:hypothetical protein